MTRAEKEALVGQVLTWFFGIGDAYVDSKAFALLRVLTTSQLPSGSSRLGHASALRVSSTT